MEEWTFSMSHALVNKIKPIPGLSGIDKTILKELADLSANGETVFIHMDRLVLYTGFSYSTIQRSLRRFERRGVLVPLERKGGRGSIPQWRIDLSPLYVPAVTEPLPAIPPTNGHVVPPEKPLTVHDPLPPETPERKAEIKAMLAAKKAELLAKKQEEKRERPGRTARKESNRVKS